MMHGQKNIKLLSVVCRLCGCNIFFHIISKTARYLEKKKPNIKHVFWFCLQHFSETLLIVRRIQLDIIMNAHMQYPLFFSPFNKT